MSASDMRGRNKEVRMSLRSSGLRCYPPAPLDRRRACFHIQLSSSRACAGRYVQVPSPLAGLGRGNCNGGALGTPSPALPHRKSGLPDLRKMKWRNRGKRGGAGERAHRVRKPQLRDLAADLREFRMNIGPQRDRGREQVTTGSSGSSGFPRAMVLSVSYALSPVSRAFLPPSQATMQKHRRPA